MLLARGMQETVLSGKSEAHLTFALALRYNTGTEEDAMKSTRDLEFSLEEKQRARVEYAAIRRRHSETVSAIAAHKKGLTDQETLLIAILDEEDKARSRMNACDYYLEEVISAFVENREPWL